jgi:hypothetical protein
MSEQSTQAPGARSRKMPMPLNAPLRARINKLAHQQGQRYESAQKAALIALVMSARYAGQNFDELNALVNRMEAGHV